MTTFLRMFGATALGLTLLLTASSCGNSNNDREIVFICPSLDIVVIVDTSDSMHDEDIEICTHINDATRELRSRDLDVRVTVLGITDDADDREEGFTCLTDNVVDLLGVHIPEGRDEIDDTEDWADAVSVVSRRFKWEKDAVRVIIPISDEDPQDGDGCDRHDEDAIENAIIRAQEAAVSVWPIRASELLVENRQDTDCIEPLMTELATETGGQFARLDNKEADLGDDIAFSVDPLCERIIR